MGGGAMHIELPVIYNFKTSSSGVPLLSSSSNLNLPVSANPGAPLGSSSTGSGCSCHSGTWTKVDSVDGTEDKRASGSLKNFVFGSVPSRLEVERAVAALQSFTQRISSFGPELKWLHPMFESFDPKLLLPKKYRRVFDAFRLLQAESSIKRLVVSLASDKAVWDAVMNNEVVQELRESAYSVQSRGLEEYKEEELGSLTISILRWILDVTKSRVTELIERIQSLVNELFRASSRDKTAAGNEGDKLEEILGSSLLISIVVLLIVVIARAQRA